LIPYNFVGYMYLRYISKQFFKQFLKRKTKITNYQTIHRVKI